jgi:hypothetical protein
MLDSPALGLLAWFGPPLAIIALMVIVGVVREIFYTIPPREERKHHDQGQGRRRTWLS